MHLFNTLDRCYNVKGDNMNIVYEATKNHIMYSRKQLPTNILHWHDSIELCRSISGDCEFTIDNKTYKFNKGDIVIIPSKCIHKFTSNGSNYVNIFLIPTQDFMPIIRHYPSIPIYISHEKICQVNGLAEQIDDLFNKIHNAYQLNIPYSQTLSLSYALSLTALLLMTFPPAKTSHGKKWKYFQPVFDEIKNDCTKPEYSLHYFAKKLNYTPEYFSTMFKSIVGIGFKDYLDRQRIEEAKRLLLINYSSISNIAEHCGFTNIRTFNNRFKALENMTPTEFINKYISKENEDTEEFINNII